MRNYRNLRKEQHRVHQSGMNYRRVQSFVSILLCTIILALTVTFLAAMGQLAAIYLLLDVL